MTKNTILAIMAKQPVIGKTKTRLCPFLSGREAAQLYEALLLDTIRSATRLSTIADLAVAVTPPEARAYFENNTPPGVKIHPVAGADIGECLERTLEAMFATGYGKVLALNSDGPHLPRVFLKQAILLLDHADIVLGPSQDGGYYLVGMRQMHNRMFQDIEWSTAKVFMQTLERAIELGLGVGLTPSWYDIDTPQDLLRLEDELRLGPSDNLLYTRAILQQLDLLTRTV
jgi:uncharacterized protein